jgi:hypothetical protein
MATEVRTRKQTRWERYAEFWQMSRRQFAILLLLIGAVDMVAACTQGYSAVDWIAAGRLLCEVNLIIAGLYGLLTPER